MREGNNKVLVTKNGEDWSCALQVPRKPLINKGLKGFSGRKTPPE
jgi:hypothetical protein